MKNKLKLIAFYLPQFHIIPENDKWWGVGFTDWTNVRKTKPLFSGHYQPHVPDELGYYDLRDPKIREKQSKLAKENGIYGFCYYHYWFNGKKLLDMPLKEILKSGKPDFPFCVCWANENWTRKWDGGNEEIIFKQKYSTDDAKNFILDLIPMFLDKRYIRINGKPLLLVYRTELISEIKIFSRIWRKIAKAKGVGDLYLVRVENFDANVNPQDIGFDAAVEFGPDWANKGEKIRVKRFSKKIANKMIKKNLPAVYDYDVNMKNMLSKPAPGYKLFRCIYPAWDNTPRQGTDGMVFLNSSPGKFEYYFERFKKYTHEHFKKEELVMFVNAWNEWGEGCHLEPDKKYGKAYLKVCKKMI